MKCLPVLMSLLMGLPAQAEYRAFLLRIEKVNNPEEFRLVPSNLDPLQYADYYPLAADERIFYTDTWMCGSRSRRTQGFARICDSPRAQQDSSTGEDLPAPTSVENLK